MLRHTRREVLRIIPTTQKEAQRWHLLDSELADFLFSHCWLFFSFVSAQNRRSQRRLLWGFVPGFKWGCGALEQYCLKQTHKCKRDSVKMYMICLWHQLHQHTIHSTAVQKGKLAASTCEIFASSSKHLLCFCLAHSGAPFLFTIHHSPDWWCLPGKPSSCPRL